MELIDEIKKLRDECINEENYYNERFDLWMRYKGEMWPELPSDAAACQSVGAIRSKLDKIISDYKPEPVKHGKWLPDRTRTVYWICSCCGFPSEAHGAFKLYKYCPNCGAKMDNEMESDHPYFKKGTMYKGMENNRNYTLEDLEL